jgi:hypothetical protein
MKRLLPFVLALLVITSCNNDKKNAKEFNDTLAQITLDIEARGKEIGTGLSTGVQTRDFSTVATKTSELQAYITEKIKVVEDMKNVGGSEDLKASMLSYLKFEKEVVGDAFVPFGKMGPNTTEEEINTAAQYIMERSKDEATYMTKLRSEQLKYASKNGLQMEKAKE